MSAPRRAVVLTDRAEADLESIALYGLAQWDEDQSRRSIAAIIDTMDNLARFPSMGRREEDIAAELRSIAIADHRILYRLEADAVRVLRIVHQRMDAAKWVLG